MKPDPDITAFRNDLRAFLSDVEVVADAPSEPSGLWWIDVSAGKFRCALSWKRGEGFGVFTDEESYGVRPDELYEDPGLAARRVKLLHDSWKDHRSLDPLWLSDVRYLLGAQQEELATALDVKQPAVSRLESRPDVRLSSLISYVSAFGGVLELKLHFKTWQAVISPPHLLAGGKSRSKTAKKSSSSRSGRRKRSEKRSAEKT